MTLNLLAGDQVSVADNGAYLIPVVWNNRLLIFFPQFLQKTAPRTSQIEDKTIKAIGDDKASDHKPVEYWEIKMGWSEYRNRKWTQKQISADAYRSTPTQVILLTPIDQFRFTPRIMTDAAIRDCAIEVFSRTRWLPHGSLCCLAANCFSDERSSQRLSAIRLIFTVYPTSHEVHSLQAVDAGLPPFVNSPPFFTLARYWGDLSAQMAGR